MKKVTLFLAIIFICSNIAAIEAQTTEVDSLIDLLSEHAKADTTRVNLLIEIASKLCGKNSTEALKYIDEAEENSTKLNYWAGMAKSYQIKGKCLSLNSDHLPAIDYFNKSLKIFFKTGDTINILNCIKNIADAYKKQGMYPEAIDYLEKSLFIYTNLGDKRSISNCLHGIGLYFEYQGNYPKALEYYQKTLKIYKELKDTTEIWRCLNSLGILYNSQKNYPKAHVYYLDALKLSKALEQSNDLNYKNKISICLNNIGDNYKYQGQYDEALENLQEALKINTEIKNKKSIAINLINIGEVYYSQKKYLEALDYYQKALMLFSERKNKSGICCSYLYMGAVYLRINNNIKSLDYTLKSLKIANELELCGKKREIHRQLSDIYANKMNYKKAYEHFVLYKNLNDSIFNKNNIKEITSLENKYEFEKEKALIALEQQKKNAIHDAETKRQKHVRNSFIIGFGLMVLLVLVVFGSLLQKRKANRILASQKNEIEEKNSELIKKNQEIQDQAKQIESANEKLKEDEQFVIMGKLIAGISHEVNTPLGIGITGSSTIVNETGNIFQQFEQKRLTENELLEFLEKTKENAEIILDNLMKADQHIGGLKRISRDQISELPRRFLLKSYIDDIIHNLKHEWKRHGTKEEVFQIDCDESMEIYSLPGALSQIFTNLIINSFRHGLNQQKNWKISISAKRSAQSLNIVYQDNGKGVKKKYLPDKIFKAFFTTNINTGGSGLGLYIVRDLIENKLNGKISCKSKFGHGITFTMDIHLLA
jgi:signal transduction histidine kinase